MITFENISIEFDNRKIFTDLSFIINNGNKAVLKGRSGMGKSTIINCIMGFCFPITGIIHFEDEIINKQSISNIRKQIAWLPQNTNSIGVATVKDTIYYPFTFGVNKNNYPKLDTIYEAFDCLGLNKELINQEYMQLSGGEKQRIGIIICKLLNKKLLLIDEPTSALDKDSLVRVANYLLNDKDKTIISTSHDSQWIERCNQIIDL